MTEYWDKEIETMPQDKIKELQLKLFNRQLERANKAPAYQDKLPQKINTLDEVKNLPFTCKDDLRQNFPYGFLAVARDKIARFNTSSGTTGIPTLAFFTKEDLGSCYERTTRLLYSLNITKGIFQIMLPLCPAVGGWNFYHAASQLDMTILPTGLVNAEKQLLMIKSLQTEYSISTPSFFAHICEILDKEKLEIPLKKTVLIGEPLSISLQKFFLEKHRIEVFRGYGLTECGGGVCGECLCRHGLHLYEDHFFYEIINPETGNLVPDGEYGELVVTPLQQEAMPLIRYRTRDITRFLSGDCPCGRTHRRIEPITHRIDDMMIINGVNVFPSQIEECIYKHLTTTTNYLIHIKEKDGLKKLVIDIELLTEQLQNLDGMKKLEYELIQTLKSYITVTPRLNFIPIGTLPEKQGKFKRVVKDI